MRAETIIPEKAPEYALLRVDGELFYLGKNKALCHKAEAAINNYERMKDMIDECRLQLEYLNDKFGQTSTTNSVLSRIQPLLSELNK